MDRYWRFEKVDGTVVHGRVGGLHQYFREHRGEMVACTGSGRVEPRHTQHALELNDIEAVAARSVLRGGASV